MDISKSTLTARLLDVVENDIVPMTRAGVATGNKVFGAAILRKSDLSLVIAGTNAETANPLWHGEISTLKAFYEMPEGERPDTKDCVFLTTHEPCSLCLSAITWTGFDNFYYFFGYEDTRDAFHIPHDLKILQEVFKIQGGEYARKNDFWQCHDLIDQVNQCSGDEGECLREQVSRIKSIYDELSATYQDQKDESSIPLS